MTAIQTSHQATPTPQHKPERLLSLSDVLDRFPVSRSHWWAGIKAGRYPQPVPITSRTRAWRESDIEALIQRTIAGTRPQPL